MFLKLYETISKRKIRWLVRSLNTTRISFCKKTKKKSLIGSIMLDICTKVVSDNLSHIRYNKLLVLKVMNNTFFKVTGKHGRHIYHKESNKYCIPVSVFRTSEPLGLQIFGQLVSRTAETSDWRPWIRKACDYKIFEPVGEALK